MKSVFIKRRYFDFRQGSITLSPIMQFSNFLMLAYLTINEVIPFELFVPMFVMVVITSFTLVGSKFRNHQLPTDINMGYEKSTEAAKTVVQMMSAQKRILSLLDADIPKEFEDRLEYMRKIGDGEI